MSTCLPSNHPTHPAGPQARASRSLRALRTLAAHEPCTHAARVRCSHTPRTCANRQQPQAKPPPRLFVQKLDEVDNDGNIIKWCIGHFQKEHAVACYHGVWYVVTQDSKSWHVVPKANYKRSEADAYNACAKNRTPAQPTEHSHTQLTTHSHTLAHRSALRTETVEWRELKAQKGKKFEYFDKKPSWLEDVPIPNYFTRKDE